MHTVGVLRHHLAISGHLGLVIELLKTGHLEHGVRLRPLGIIVKGIFHRLELGLAM